MKRKIYIGTSGWIYKSWENKFYPKKLEIKKLEFYAKYFKTVEINFSFYKLPSKKSFKEWFDITPKSFSFSVKLSRYISHIKKLKIDVPGKKGVRNFIKNASELKNKLKVILIQLPNNSKFNEERLENFIEYFLNQLLKTNIKCKIAFEFRNETWFNNSTYNILKKYNVALVISHSSHYPFVSKLTANFTYIRLHGPSFLYASKYDQADLKKWKSTINLLPKNIKDVFIYFNNDFNAYAIENAQYLKEILAK